MELWNNALGVDPVFEEEITSAERIGNRIRTVRMEAGKSLSELGEEVGLNADRMQKYENGQRKPKADMLKKIADALAVSEKALQEPELYTHLGVMYALFEMERLHDLRIQRADDRITLCFGDGKTGYINDFLDEWEKEQQYIDSEVDSSTSDEDKKAVMKEYHGWEWNFPAAIVRRSKEELIGRLQKKIDYLQQEESDKRRKDDEG